MTERIDERLQAMGVDTSEMTDEQKFTAATGLTRYAEYEANNPWYVPGGAANVPAGAAEPTGEGDNTNGNTSTTEPTSPTSTTEPTGEPDTAEQGQPSGESDTSEQSTDEQPSGESDTAEQGEPTGEEPGSTGEIITGDEEPEDTGENS